MTTDSQTSLPAGVGNAYLFQIFNTISFSIVLMTPMILYFKDLGASATVLGIVASLPALLNVLQIPAAQFVERVGYRAFVLRGWTARSLVILVMAAVAFLPGKIDATTRMALMLLLLFVFNASRGISLCGFLPWITHWIPENVRGRYLSRDQLCSASAMVGTMVLSAGFLRRWQSGAAYGWLFFGSFVAAGVSLLFLRRIPDVPVSAESRSTGPVPWKAILLHRPFFWLLIYNFIIFTSLAGAGVFWVPLLRDYFACSDTKILLIGSVGGAVVAVSVLVFGSLVDRVGSRPLLAFANVVFILHFFGWGALASGSLALNLGSILFVQTTAGMAIAALNLANTRLAMSTVPVMGRSHFLAVFSVVNSLALGVMPIFWGILLDSLAGWHCRWGLWEWNQYSVLYMAIIGVAMVAQWMHRKLTEPRAMDTETFFRELLVKSPARVVSRVLARRPFA